MNRPLIFGGALSALLLASSVTWMLWPDPEPEPTPEALEDQDTGLDRTETEDLMRTIGYIQ